MVAMSDPGLCPFSKPIIGQWCCCPHAILAERCSGKMACGQAEYRPACVELVSLFKQQSRFVLGLASDDAQLTHAQLMKIRCGGLLGMQRLLQPSITENPCVRDMITGAEQRFGQLSAFPFNDILRDISSFSHRKKLRQY